MELELKNIIDYQAEAFPKDTVINYIANAEPIMVQTKIVNPEPYDRETELLLKDLYSEIAHLFRKEPYSLMTDEELKKYVLDRTKAVLRYNLFKEITVQINRINEDNLQTIDKDTERSYWD